MMKNKEYKIVELEFIKSKEIYIGCIINENDDFIFIKGFDEAGDFYDYSLIKKSEVRIINRSKYLYFFKKIINNDNKYYLNFLSLDEMLKFAIKNKKIIAISSRRFNDKISKPVKLENGVLEYSPIKDIITLKKLKTINLSEITLVSIGGYELETIGDLINSCINKNRTYRKFKGRCLIGKVCKLYGNNNQKYQLGQIINIDENYIYYKEFNHDGRYDGIRIKNLKYIRKIVTDSKCLEEFKLIIKNDCSNFKISTLYDIFKIAITKHKLIEISCFKWSYLHTFFLLNYNLEEIYAKRISLYGEILSNKKIFIDEIDFIKFDTRLLRSYEKNLFK